MRRQILEAVASSIILHVPGVDGVGEQPTSSPGLAVGDGDSFGVSGGPGGEI